jgi:hypothetical protein
MRGVTSLLGLCMLLLKFFNFEHVILHLFACWLLFYLTCRTNELEKYSDEYSDELNDASAKPVSLWLNGQLNLFAHFAA